MAVSPEHAASGVVHGHGWLVAAAVSSPALRNAWAPFLCARCAAELRPYRHDVDLGTGPPGRGLFVYAGPCRSLIRALKFQGYVSIGRHLGRDMVPLLEPIPAGVINVVPIPLHWRRQWARGHNPGQAIASALAMACPGGRLRLLLRRTRPTAPQVGRGLVDRERNTRGAFTVAPCHRHRDWRSPVVLVDDVVTTGATMRAALRCLHAAGVRRVRTCAAAVTAARSPPRPSATR